MNQPCACLTSQARIYCAHSAMCCNNKVTTRLTVLQALQAGLRQMMDRPCSSVDSVAAAAAVSPSGARHAASQPAGRPVSRSRQFGGKSVDSLVGQSRGANRPTGEASTTPKSDAGRRRQVTNSSLSQTEPHSRYQSARQGLQGQHSPLKGGRTVDVADLRSSSTRKRSPPPWRGSGSVQQPCSPPASSSCYSTFSSRPAVGASWKSATFPGPATCDSADAVLRGRGRIGGAPRQVTVPRVAYHPPPLRGEVLAQSLGMQSRESLQREEESQVG